MDDIPGDSPQRAPNSQLVDTVDVAHGADTELGIAEGTVLHDRSVLRLRPVAGGADIALEPIRLPEHGAAFQAAPEPVEVQRPADAADPAVGFANLRRLYCRFGKRAVDLLLGLLLLLALLPALLIVTVVLRVHLGKGVLFRQRRVGRDGKPFTMVKFRTMRHSRRQQQAEFDGPDRRLTHKSAVDPRHTRIGRLLRRTSLDELPQIVHVVTGRMSLVGPRPELEEIVDLYDLWDHPRHLVKPGITGLWQVGRRNEGELLHECVDDDLLYVSSISLTTDLKILARTGAVLLRAGGR